MSKKLASVRMSGEGRSAGDPSPVLQMRNPRLERRLGSCCMPRRRHRSRLATLQLSWSCPAAACI